MYDSSQPTPLRSVITTIGSQGHPKNREKRPKTPINTEEREEKRVIRAGHRLFTSEVGLCHWSRRPSKNSLFFLSLFYFVSRVVDLVLGLLRSSSPASLRDRGFSSAFRGRRASDSGLRGRPQAGEGGAWGALGSGREFKGGFWGLVDFFWI